MGYRCVSYTESMRASSFIAYGPIRLSLRNFINLTSDPYIVFTLQGESNINGEYVNLISKQNKIII